MCAHSCFRRLRALTKDDFRAIRRRESELPPESLKLSLLIPARESSRRLEGSLREAHAFLSERFGGDFEIILIPNPPPDAGPDASVRACEALAGGFARVKVVPHLSPPMSPGKGAALRAGFLASAGRIIFFTDADLPYDLGFIDAALAKMDQGFDLVSANRRIPGGRPGGRRRLGLIFNGAVRLLFPVGTRDTQAGFKAMSRRLAAVAFSRGLCPGFFFDLEIFLSWLGMGWAHAEVPVAQRRETGESTICIPRESVLAVYWLIRIRAGHANGRYAERAPCRA